MITYTDKEVITKKYEIKHELCKDEFHQTFQAQQAGFIWSSQWNPSYYSRWYPLAMMNNMGALVDREIWQALVLQVLSQDFLAQFVADGDVIDIVGSASTVANVQGELAKVYATIPEEIINEQDLIIAVSPNVARNYKLSQVKNYNGLEHQLVTKLFRLYWKFQWYLSQDYLLTLS